MFRTVSNGQSIHQYIPPDLKRMFYKNPASIHASHNGLDPYGFSTEGLVLYLPLWALKDSAFKSVDPYGHTCTVTGALCGSTGRTFDGDDEISLSPGGSIPAAINFGNVNTYTVMAWAKITNKTASREIFTEGNSGDDDPIIVFEYLQASAKWQFAHRDDASNVASCLSLGDPDADVWYLLTAVRRASNSFELFVDAVSQNTDATSVGATTLNTANIGVLERIAKANYMIGTIGEVWVYNRALSAAEITHLYNKTKFRYT